MVFLLFNIGLELSIERLASLAKYVFGMGSLQVWWLGGGQQGRTRAQPAPDRVSVTEGNCLLLKLPFFIGK